MTSASRPILAEYCRAGWHLVPIPLGRKGPVTARWNVRDMCIVDPEVAEWIDGNVGLAHAYSGTCAVDVDDLAKATVWFQERNIDLPRLLADPAAVRIESRPGRAKLLYALPKPLPSFKLGPFELRCAAGSGLTLQDVLPPSVHPDTGRPYTWLFGSPAAHWSALPPLPPELVNLWHALIAPIATSPRTPNPRTATPAVPGQKPPKAPGARAQRADTAPMLRKLLQDWSPDASYDEWVGVGMAIHHEMQGHEDGLAIWNEWSAKGQKYKGIGDLQAHWRSFRIDKDNPRTLASLRKETAATADEFAVVTDDAARAATAPAVTAGDGARRQAMADAMRTLRRTKLGTIEPRISNVATILGIPDLTGWDIAYDAFLDSLMIADAGTGQWRTFNDNDYTDIRVWLETAGNCEPVPHETVRHAVSLVAGRNVIDAAQTWIRTLKWDGAPRIDTFCTKYWGTGNYDYERAVGRYLWTALAGRVIHPGCQADMVPVLIGRQGVGKSRGVQALVPSLDHYVEIRLDETDDVIARKTRGVLVGELAEMRGLRAAEVERVKAFVTRTHERWVPKFKEFATQYARRFVMVGTTNDEEFLPVDTEHRRWLPVHTGRVNVQAIHKDREQLWAEAVLLYESEGIAWQGMDELAAPARQEAQGMDIWERDIDAWLLTTPDKQLLLQDVLTQALGLDPRTINRSHELRAAKILRSRGYTKITARSEKDGRLHKFWVFDPTA